MYKRRSCCPDVTRRKLDQSCCAGFMAPAEARAKLAEDSGEVNVLPPDMVDFMNIGAYCDSGPVCFQVLDQYGQQGRRPPIKGAPQTYDYVAKGNDFDVNILGRRPEAREAIQASLAISGDTIIAGAALVLLVSLLSKKGIL